MQNGQTVECLRLPNQSQFATSSPPPVIIFFYGVLVKLQAKMLYNPSKYPHDSLQDLFFTIPYHTYRNKLHEHQSLLFEI